MWCEARHKCQAGRRGCGKTGRRQDADRRLPSTASPLPGPSCMPNIARRATAQRVTARGWPHNSYFPSPATFDPAVFAWSARPTACRRSTTFARFCVGECPALRCRHGLTSAMTPSKLLAEHIISLRREGIRETLVAAAAESGDEISDRRSAGDRRPAHNARRSSRSAWISVIQRRRPLPTARNSMPRRLAFNATARRVRATASNRWSTPKACRRGRET